MKTYLDCIPCFVRQGLDAARNVSDEIRVHEQILRDVLRLTADLDMNLPPPWVGQAIHRRLRELTGVEDPYGSAKERFNRLAMEMLPDLSSEVSNAPDPLVHAAKLAIAANVIDLGMRGSLTNEQARTSIRQLTRESFHGDWDSFRRQIGKAAHILYLADNSGEIAIDRLLVEQIGPERVTVAVRGRAVINDATLADAREVGMNDLVEVIDNGSDAPGTILDDCSAAFRERFHEADLVISKGQGNFETLSEAGGNIHFLLKVKCPVIADHVGLPVGTHALITSPRR